METQTRDSVIDFEQSLRRSQGRSGRVFAVTAKVTSDEKKELDAAASRSGKALSEWAREALLREACRPADDVILTELVATRMMLVNLIKPLTQGKQVTPEEFAKITAHVRNEKRKATAELMQQYEQTNASRAEER